jgi:hypothetical protein
VLKRTVPVNAAWATSGGAANGGRGGGPGFPGGGRGFGGRGGAGGNAAAAAMAAAASATAATAGGPGGASSSAAAAAPGPPAVFLCNRCQRTGHIAKFCPTLGDARFDPEIRLMNVPKTGRKTVSSLEGIDTSTATVIERSDGSYEVFESSLSGLEKLNKEGYVPFMLQHFCFFRKLFNFIVLCYGVAFSPVIPVELICLVRSI